MPYLPRRLFPCLLLWLALLWPAWAPAQGQQAAAPGADAQLQAIDQGLQQAQAALPGLDKSDALRALADTVLDAQRQADALSTALQPQLQQVGEQLAQLGDASAGEAAQVASQRRDLQKQKTVLDGQVKRAGLLSVTARQLGADIERARADQLGEQLSARVASPLSLTLWRQAAAAAPDDRQRLAALAARQQAVFAQAVARQGWAVPVVGTVLAVLLLWPLRWLLRWLGRRFAADHGPSSRLRRSGLALWRMLVGTLLPTAAAWVLVQSLRGVDAIAPALDTLAEDLLRLTLVSVLIASVAAALLTRQPSWRLLAVEDATAVRLRSYARAAASLVWLSGMLLLVCRAARLSATAVAVADALTAVCFAVLVVAMLVSLVRVQAPTAADDAPPAQASARRHSGVVNIVALLGQVVVAAALVAALLGYVNLALFAVRQVVWTATVVAAVGLLAMFVDDLMQWLFQPEGRIGRAAGAALGLRASHLQQAAVLLSAVLRLWLLVAGMGLLLVPYGTNLQTLLSWLGVAGHGFSIGGVPFRPAAVFPAIAVLVIGLGLVSAFQRWLTRTYLPRTELETGTRASIATVLRYLGLVVVGLWTLSALGMDVSNLALLASALSVGIGFGLQAITQNFISGLILMAERPVKIGDWVRIGDAEGDVRRINVRSTEIQVADKSTLIVPNSDLITKTIRNMTMSSPLGRIQLQFSLPLSADVAQVRALLMGLYAGHADVLDEPAPAVYIDSIAGGQVAINSFAYCTSPRLTYRTRSDLFFALLQALAEADIALSTPQDIRIVQASADGDGPG